MSGVYDENEFWCSNCKKSTLHETGWESEFPNQLDVKCKECGRSETLKDNSGDTT